MERLQPIDLEKTQFQRQFRGYHRAQVEQTLAQAAQEITTLRQEIQKARETAEAALKELEHFRTQESTLKETLILAQKTADETKALAHKEADLILQQAQQKAADLERQAQKHINNLRWEIERLNLERQKFEQRLRGLLNEHSQTLESGRLFQPALVNLEIHELSEPEGAPPEPEPHPSFGEAQT
ncbi:MAG TPA: DivIVA domain-containing protein [Fimbriimonadaceae bacterium]|nr:DivIVA domain-containing protein [Fimbriimonadaceae bacterium]HRJ32734.1 DivIVA domain-containing protein [Fimbriimonadaceae bacterium]